MTKPGSVSILSSAALGGIVAILLCRIALLRRRPRTSASADVVAGETTR